MLMIYRYVMPLRFKNILEADKPCFQLMLGGQWADPHCLFEFDLKHGPLGE